MGEASVSHGMSHVAEAESVAHARFRRVAHGLVSCLHCMQSSICSLGSASGRCNPIPRSRPLLGKMLHSAWFSRISEDAEWRLCCCQPYLVQHSTETSLAQPSGSATTPCLDAEVCGSGMLGLPAEEEHAGS